MSRPIIQNIVCTCNIGSTLYLPQVCRCLHVMEYNPKRFAAVTFRQHNPSATALIFSSGRIVCTGTKSRMDARLAMISFVYTLHQRMNLNINVHQFAIQNIVASASTGFSLCLPDLYAHHSRQSSYDPELFPGLIFRDSTLPAVVLIFESGKMVITGAKKEKDVTHVYNTIIPLLIPYMSEQNIPPSTTFKDVLKHVRGVPVLSLDDFAPLLNEHI